MNYYNENDPKAAAWLRELIRCGHIAAGIVDERSIVEVQPDDLAGYTQCHFFAGIGGWSYALRLARWPDDEPVWTGSCPCQPLSCAGQGKGDADERHLWPALYRFIAQRTPAIVFGEQVASALGREWLAGVRADLEGIGYAVGAADLCAAGVGAPHRRQRLFWVADTASERERSVHAGGNCEGGFVVERPESRSDGVNNRTAGRLADADGGQSGNRELQRSGQHGQQQEDGILAVGLADAGCKRDERGGGPTEALGTDGKAEGEAPQRERGGLDAGNSRATGTLADDKREGLEGHAGHEREGDQPGRVGADATGPVAASGAVVRLGHSKVGGWSGHGVRRDGEPPQRNQKATTETVGDTSGGGCGVGGDASQPGGGGHVERAIWSRFEVVHCRDGKTRRFESGSFPLAHGIPGRVGLLRGYGNAIVPQLAAQFIQAARETGAFR